nr:hypothetical protein [Tanacetum cinerariifolium]
MHKAFPLPVIEFPLPEEVPTCKPVHSYCVINIKAFRVLALEEAKTTQDKVITRLKLRVRRLKKKRKARTSQPMNRKLFKDIVDTSTDNSIEDKGSGEKGGSTADQVSTARPKVSVATPATPPTTTITIFGDEDLIIAHTSIKTRSEKAKEEGVAFRDVEEPPRPTDQL